MSSISKFGRSPVRHWPRWFTNVTTEPNLEAYWWHNRHSYFSYIAVTIILLTRLFPLQLIKVAFRSRERRTTPVDQERRDIHSAYTEVYFITLSTLWVLCFILCWQLNYFRPEQEGELFSSTSMTVIAVRVLAGLFLIESVGWILYYLFFRVLIERRFSIYSLSEYLFAIPFVIFYQFILISLAANLHFRAVLENFFQYGQTSEGYGHLLVAVLRTIYVSLLVAYVVSLYPKMKIKIGLDFISIGKSGAYEKYYTKALRPMLASTLEAFEPKENNLNGFFEEFKIFSAKHQIIYIISTPTLSHFQYISHLAGVGRDFFVEKPIVSNFREFQILEADFDRYFKRAFFLQYYVLEKALAVTYLRFPFPEYEKFLRIGKNKSFEPEDRERILWKFTHLGRLKKVSIVILEGDGRSHSTQNLHWTESRTTGGMLFDLGIHGFSLLRLLGGTDADLVVNGIVETVSRKRLSQLSGADRRLLAPTKIAVSGSLRGDNADEVAFHVELGKHIEADHCQRELKAEYEHGHVTCDLDEETTKLLNHHEPERVETLSCFSAPSPKSTERIKYYGMFDLGVRQLDGQWAHRVDIPQIQFAGLRDLFALEQMLDRASTDAASS